MATATKVKNGKIAHEVADAANKAAEETKEMVDMMVDAANKAFANSKPMVDAQQKMYEDSFAMWQEMSQNYMAFVTKATQQMFDQSMAFQKDMLGLAEANMKQLQDLYAAEQEMVFEAAEAFQAQAQAANERMAKMFTPVFPTK